MIGNNDQKKITAYTIADGWYDSSNNYRPEIKEGREVCVKNIAGYLDGSCDAFEINTPENAEEIAAKIYDCLIGKRQNAASWTDSLPANGHKTGIGL